MAGKEQEADSTEGAEPLSRWQWVKFAANTVIVVTADVIVVLLAVRLAEEGGWWWVGVPLLAFVGLSHLVLRVFIVLAALGWRPDRRGSPR